MRPADIIAGAEARTGLSDPGDDDFREGLDRLILEVGSWKGASTAGLAVFEQICIGLAANRLRVLDWHQRHPAVSAAPVERPVFVLGAPRTGTTLLHNLLASDLARRPLLRWEAFDSIPPPERDTWRTDPRCLAMKSAEQHTTASSIHHEEADGPTECVVLVGQHFRSLMLDTMVEVPEYQAWLLSTDMASTYAYHRRALQALQSNTSNNWLLKMPSHALAIDALVRQYPDARIIVTHRDPYQAFASNCSLIANVRGQFGAVDRARIGPSNIRQFSAHLQRPVAHRQKAGGHQIIDVHYSDLRTDPLATARAVYAALGDDFTPDVESSMRAWLAANPQGRFGHHSYNLEQFGFSKDELRPYFEEYIRSHGIACEEGEFH